MRRKIDQHLIRLVLQIRKKNPHYGVRQIAQVLRAEHSRSVSKSTVHTILKKRGPRLHRGRKKAAVRYARRTVQECGLFLLRGVDAHLELSREVAAQLHELAPKIPLTQLRKLVLACGFSAYEGGTIEMNSKKRGFLRMAGLARLPKRRTASLLALLERETARISLQTVGMNARAVAAIRVKCGNGRQVCCDARFSTLWPRPRALAYCVFPLGYVAQQVAWMRKNNFFFCFFALCRDYLADGIFDFFDALESGIESIEYLDPHSKPIGKFDCGGWKPRCAIGYFPKHVGRGISFLTKPGRFSRVEHVPGEVYAGWVSTRFQNRAGDTQRKAEVGFLRRRRIGLPLWGVICGRRSMPLLKAYVRRYPEFDQQFPAEERVFMEKAPDIVTENVFNLVPAALTLGRERDFRGIGEVLAAILKAEIGTVEVRMRSGEVIPYRHTYRVVMPSLPSTVRTRVNYAGFLVGNKRVFIE
ncbi:MAG: hypothetical protein GF333_07955 [Candidatus Omnitrophica bacterium]|nr:hypothetical protein [Candidatus Omnitrophota bacterium]